MAKANRWKTAREDAGYTQLEAAIEARSHLPERYWIDPTKLSRFETGGPAIIDPIALGVLAELYGKNLRELDPTIADELDEIEETLRGLRRTRRKYAPRDSNPEPAGMGAERRLGADVTSGTSLQPDSDSRAA